MRWTRELVSGARAQPWLTFAVVLLVLAVALSATAAFMSVATAHRLDEARDRAVAQACVDDWQDVEARRDDAARNASRAVTAATSARIQIFPNATPAQAEEFAVIAREEAADAAEQARGDIPDPACDRAVAEARLNE